MTIDEVLREMRTNEMRGSRRIEVWVLEQWADAIEAAMTQPAATVRGYYMFPEDAEPRFTEIDKINLPEGTKLYALPPDAQAEIERLKSQNTRLAGRIGCGCGGDYGLCNECAAALAGEEEKR
jgi:hypothetical protein